MVGRGVLLDVAAYKGADPLPVDYWISTEDLQNTAKAQNVEIRKGDIPADPDGMAEDVG